MKLRKRLIVLAALTLLPIIPALAAAAPPLAGGGDGPQLLSSETNDTSPPLKHIPVPPATPQPFRKIPRQDLPRIVHQRPHEAPDPVVQSAPGAEAAPATLNSFDGAGNVNNVLPPDVSGAVGPNHYVQWVNLAYAVWDKSGRLLLGPRNGNTLFTGFGGPCETTNSGDPIVLYDHLADRWLLSQFALPNGTSGPFYQCLAVSQTGDPTGAFYRYAFKISDTKLNDYPKLAIWPDGYYMSVNQYTCKPFCTWAGAGAVAFDRAKMLAGQPASAIYFDLYARNPNLGGMLPSTLDGPAPAGGTPNYFVQVDDDAWGYSGDQLQVWEFKPDWTTPSASTFTFAQTLATQAFDSNLCGYSRNCIPQLGTSAKVDAISDRLLWRLQYRILGGVPHLIGNHTVDVAIDRAGIRWYELQKASTSWGISQQGTFSPGTSGHRWMASIAMDKDGNIALGYSKSDPAAGTYPSINYTGRLAGDPAGVMTQGEGQLVAGGGYQTHSSGRWGDYSTLSVDPADDCTFWYTQEYYASASSAGWRTRIGSFRFASCGSAPSPSPSADLSIVKSASPNPVQGADMTFTLAVSNTGPDGATNVTVTDALPAGLTFKSATSTQGTCSGTSTVTCGLGTVNAGAGATVGIVVTPVVQGAVNNTATVSGGVNDPTASNNQSSVSVVIAAAPPPASSAPGVTSCSPSSGSRNQQLNVTVSGANFQNGAAVSFGDRIAVQSVTVQSASQILARIKVHPQAVLGARTVTITNPDGRSGSLAACFSVN